MIPRKKKLTRTVVKRLLCGAVSQTAAGRLRGAVLRLGNKRNLDI